MFDADFNPHQDIQVRRPSSRSACAAAPADPTVSPARPQAIARAYRFGQKKKVIVFKL